MYVLRVNLCQTCHGALSVQDQTNYTVIEVSCNFMCASLSAANETYRVVYLHMLTTHSQQTKPVKTSTSAIEVS